MLFGFYFGKNENWIVGPLGQSFSTYLPNLTCMTRIYFEQCRLTFLNLINIKTFQEGVDRRCS